MLRNDGVDYFSVFEAAKELDKTTRTVFSYIKDKRLVAFRFGVSRVWHIEPRSVEALKASVRSNNDTPEG